MKEKEAFFMLARYLSLILLALGNLAVFYWIFTPLTAHLSFFILSFIDTSTEFIASTSTIVFQGAHIALVSACIAGAAYYLLAILNLTTPMKMEQRVKSLAFLWAAFLVLNVVRIVVFSLMIGQSYFSVTHKLVWYFGSTILVVGLWFFNVWLFGINEIPFYSDVVRLSRTIAFSHGRKK